MAAETAQIGMYLVAWFSDTSKHRDYNLDHRHLYGLWWQHEPQTSTQTPGVIRSWIQTWFSTAVWPLTSPWQCVASRLPTLATFLTTFFSSAFFSRTWTILLLISLPFLHHIFGHHNGTCGWSQPAIRDWEDINRLVGFFHLPGETGRRKDYEYSQSDHIVRTQDKIHLIEIMALHFTAHRFLF